MPDIPLLMVVAHPDDEIIGAGIRLARLPDPARRHVTILYVTDGAPRDLRWTRNAGFDSRQEYSDARRRERTAALQIAGINPVQCRDFNYADQETWLHLPEITHRLAELIGELRPAVILTHPYEGGHPDHDSCAFACRRALDLCRRPRPRAEEFACYHRGANGFRPQEFLPEAGLPVTTILLKPRERQRKQRMYDCHRTQQHVLQSFSTVDEKFRPAPEYDFHKPPHEGALQYETLGWEITGAMWRARAAEAIELLNKLTVWV